MVLFKSDNSFFGGEENDCLLLKIIPPINELLEVNKTHIDISNGLEFELKMYF